MSGSTAQRVTLDVVDECKALTWSEGENKF